MASTITLTNRGTENVSIQNHMAGRVVIPAAVDEENPGVVIIKLSHAKDITSQAFLKKFYNQYAEFLEITYDIDDYPLEADFADVDTEAESPDVTMFGHKVSDLQENDVVVDGDGYAITGTLKYLAEGELVEAWGAGNFLALKFDWNDDRVTSVKVGLDPSYNKDGTKPGKGLAEIINDPDRDGAWKITNKFEQKFVVETRAGDELVNRQEYDLTGLVTPGVVVSAPGKGNGAGGVDVVSKVTSKPVEASKPADDAKVEEKAEASKAAAKKK